MLVEPRVLLSPALLNELLVGITVGICCLIISQSLDENTGGKERNIMELEKRLNKLKPKMTSGFRGG